MTSSDRLSWKARGVVGLVLVAMTASFVALYVTTDAGGAGSGSAFAVGSGGDGEAAPPPATDASGNPTPTTADTIVKVGMVGDSLTEGVKDALPPLGAAHGLAFEIDAERGREADGAAPLVQKVASGRDVVVVALGTNDSRRGLGAAAARKLIDEILLQVGSGQTVLWVNVVRQDSKATVAAAAVFDQALAQAADRFENLTVLDWAAYVQAHKAVMSGDKIHLTEKGYQERAQWLVDQIASALAARQNTGG